MLVCVCVCVYVRFFFFRVSGGGLTPRCPDSNSLANEGCEGLKGVFGGQLLEVKVAGS